MRPVEGEAPPAESLHRNEVVLVGRVAAAPEERELPSGDLIVVWRLVVDRPPARKGAPAGTGQRSPTVDTLDCVAWTPGVKRKVVRWEAGDVLAVNGALRRRFWRAGAAAVSRYEVEVTAAQRLRKADKQK